MDFRSENTTAIELENGETIRLLKTAAVFGANASGKSNLIWALYSLSHMVAGSLKYDVNTPIPPTFLTQKQEINLRNLLSTSL